MKESRENARAIPHGATLNHWRKVLVTDDSFSSISFGDAQFGMATGTDERLWLTDDGGLSWTKQTIRPRTPTGGEYTLAKATVASSDSLYALGHLEDVGSAIFESRDRGKTASITYYPGASLNAIDSIGNHIWIVGTIESEPVVLHSRASGRWTRIWRGQRPNYLTSVDFIDSRNGWCVGARGLILHTQDGGNDWQLQQAPVEANLEGVGFADAKNGYATGQRGTIFHTADGGNTWERQDAGTGVVLTHVVAVSSSEAWVVGQKGTILHTQDGGQHWGDLSLDTEADIYALTIKEREIWVATSDGMILKFSNQQQ